MRTRNGEGGTDGRMDGWMDMGAAALERLAACECEASREGATER